MRARQHHADAGPTQAANTEAAKRKVITCRLEKLSPALLDSIAGSHAKRGTPTFTRLLAELTVLADKRRECER